MFRRSLLVLMCLMLTGCSFIDSIFGGSVAKNRTVALAFVNNTNGALSFHGIGEEGLVYDFKNVAPGAADTKILKITTRQTALACEGKLTLPSAATVVTGVIVLNVGGPNVLTVTGDVKDPGSVKAELTHPGPAAIRAKLPK